jgi:hypothetical protein
MLRDPSERRMLTEYKDVPDPEDHANWANGRLAAFAHLIYHHGPQQLLENTKANGYYDAPNVRTKATKTAAGKKLLACTKKIKPVTMVCIADEL